MRFRLLVGSHLVPDPDRPGCLLEYRVVKDQFGRVIDQPIIETDQDLSLMDTGSATPKFERID